MIIRLLLAIVVMLAAAHVLAEDCADWSETMLPPVQYQGVDSDIILAIDGLLIDVDHLVEVRDLGESDLPVLGSCAAPPGDCEQIRVVGGIVYLVTRLTGIWRLDLEDPTQPSCELVFESELPLRDIVDIPGGGSSSRQVTASAGSSTPLTTAPTACFPSLISDIGSPPGVRPAPPRASSVRQA